MRDYYEKERQEAKRFKELNPGYDLEKRLAYLDDCEAAGIDLRKWSAPRYGSICENVAQVLLGCVPEGYKGGMDKEINSRPIDMERAMEYKRMLEIWDKYYPTDMVSKGLAVYKAQGF